jgi:acyl dehydratase
MELNSITGSRPRRHLSERGSRCGVSDDRRCVTVEHYRTLAGQELGASRWVSIPQDRIDAFATITEDFQPIHVDPDMAAHSAFGGTIAHGFLTLSLVTSMADEVVPLVSEAIANVNYGLERLRFVSPVRAGSRVRGRFRLKDVVLREGNSLRSTLEVIVEIEGHDKPALVGDWLTLLLLRIDEGRS